MAQPDPAVEHHAVGLEIQVVQHDLAGFPSPNTMVAPMPRAVRVAEPALANWSAARTGTPNPGRRIRSAADRVTASMSRPFLPTTTGQG